MKTKKLLLILISLCMIVTSFTVSADVEEVNEDTFYADQIGLFKALGVLNDDDDLTADKVITRGEFIKYMVRLVDGKTPEKSDVIFWDVTESNEYFVSVYSALSYGMISGNPDGSFAPYDNITHSQAMRIILNSLGYGGYIKARGNNTAALTSAASKAGIEFGGNLEEELTFKAMIEMIYDSLDTCMLDTSSFSDDNVKYENTEKTLIETYRNIEKISGVLKANSVTSLDGKPLGDGQIIIGTYTINDADDKSESYIGYNVDCFAKKVSGGYKMFYTMLNDYNKIVRFDTDDIEGFTSSYISYYDGGKTKKVILNDTQKWIYNGAVVDFSNHSLNEILSGKYGNVTVVNNNLTGSDDVVIVNAYSTIFLNYADFENEFVYDKNSPKNNVDLKDYEKWIFVDANGNELKSAATKTTLSVLKSFDGEYFKAIVSDKKADILISEVNSEDEIFVDGVKYEVSDEYKESAGNGVLVSGTKGSAYFDVFGRISYIEQGSSAKPDVAFCVGVDTPSGLSDDVMVNLYTRAGKYEILHLNKSLEIDGMGFKSAQKILDYMKLGKRTFVPYPIAYRVNEEGKIIYIDTPSKSDSESDDTLCLRYLGNEEGPLMYKGSSNVNYRRAYGGKYIANDESFLVLINDQEDYNDLKPMLSLEDDVKYSYDVYSFGSDVPVVDIVLHRAVAASTVSKDVYIFKAMTRVTDTVGDQTALLNIKGYNKNAEVSFTVAKESEDKMFGENVISSNSKTNMTTEQIMACSDLKPGDLFRIAKDAEGNVSKVEKLYDYKNKLFLSPTANAANPNENGTWEGNSSCRLAVGDVYAMFGGWARFSTKPFSIDDADLDDKLESVYAAGYMYSADDKGNIDIVQITTGEQILGAKYGEDIKIFVRSEYTRPNLVFFIK